MRVLLTGGAGYIGSHTAAVLLDQGHDVAVFDDLSNSSLEAVRRVERLGNGKIEFFQGDLTEPAAVDDCFHDARFDAVIHCAGLKAVGESVAHPVRYYSVNVGSTLTLLDAMRKHGVHRLVFSSSATVYGPPQSELISETHPTGVNLTNPYGWSKAMSEQIIRDETRAHPGFTGVILRYFNPIGAHPSGQIGEAPMGVPNNLMPYIAQVAVGRREQLSVFGGDYDTRDGTGVRDYIHVMDLAEGHVAALLGEEPGLRTYNLGSGRGSSVLEAVRAFETASGRTIPYEICPRREGDLARVIADPSLAKTELGWEAKLGLEEACRDTWNWQMRNPRGYNGQRD